jgi:hypothetical protein
LDILGWNYFDVIAGAVNMGKQGRTRANMGKQGKRRLMGKGYMRLIQLLEIKRKAEVT